MRSTRRSSRHAACLLAGLAITTAATALACATTRQFHVRSNALEFLYPRGLAAIPPGDVTLRLPVRVGVTFAPAAPSYQDRFTATQKQALLGRVAAAFRDRPGIASVEVIPPSHLTVPAPPRPGSADTTAVGNGFQDLDRVKAAFGVDLIALISYDQVQFSETGRSAWAYWTIVGLYAVKAEKNETRTLMDAVVYDIASRTLLFSASGQSAVGDAATPIDTDRVMRRKSEEGFEKATDDLIANLGTALTAFQAQAATGTVRGPGTPAIAMLDASGEPAHGGTHGGGGFGLGELIVAALLGALALGAQTGRSRRP